MIDEAGNVIGELGAGRPTVFLCSHMDTVPGHIPLKVTRNEIYGRGAVDAKSSLCGMIIAAVESVKEGFNGRIVVAAVTDEERDSTGMKCLLKTLPTVDYAVFGEPSGIHNITVGYRGRLQIKVVCETPPGHASVPSSFDNAIERAYEVWREIQSNLTRGDMKGVTSCITQIRGGEFPNVAPGKCDFTVDIRIPLRVASTQVIDEVQETLKRYSLNNRNVNLNMKVEDVTEAFEADVRSDLVKAFFHAIKEVTKVQPKLTRKTGTGDVNVFAAKMKCPTVVYGPGDSKLDHTPNEFIDVHEYVSAIEVYKRAICSLQRGR
jgi:LysW-gamma-L-lysine carboxypeptidase